MKLSVLAIAITQVSGLLVNWNLGFEDNTPRIIKLGPDKYEIATETDKLNYRRKNVNFIDVTQRISIEEAVAQGMVVPPNKADFLDQIVLMGSKQLQTMKQVTNYVYPKKLNHEKLIKSVFPQISKTNLKDNLGNFTSYFTRYYKSQSGFDSALWLQSKIDEIISPGRKFGVTKTRIDHQGWDQFSIIVSIPGKNTTSENKGKIVVVGAHQDSINLLFPSIMRAPGADDDGSGTVTILETLRLIIGLIASGDFVPENTLEFHFYSAEEGGLLGSGDVFHRYATKGEEVVAMLQQDMTGSTSRTKANEVEEHVGLIVDYTNPNLNEFLKLAISNYCNIPYHETSCGYACSDHASAIENGYPSAFIIESEFDLSSKFIHSVLDTIDRIDFDHVVEHVKLSLGYAIELSGTTITKE